MQKGTGEVTRLQDLLEKKIKRFLSNRNRLGNPDDIRKAIASLNNFFWEKTETIISNKAPNKNEELQLDNEERLLIDMGVVHRDLVGAKDSDYETLISELQIKETNSNIFYVSEWLQYRWHLEAVLSNLKLDRLTNQMTFQNEEIYIREHERREKSFGRLKPIIIGIPGMSSKIFKTMKSNRLFYYLESELYTEVTQKKVVSDESLHMRQYFNKFLKQLQQRCLTKILKDSFFEFSESHKKICEWIVDYSTGKREEIKVVETEIENQSTLSQSHMTQNLHLLRSLINLGVTQTGTKRAFSPLFVIKDRTTKNKIFNMMKGIKSADPYLPGPPDILLAPYAGEGFFEWDRDTLVLPITTEKSLEVTFSSALAKYRILTDVLNFEGKLRASWVAEFGKENFQENFSKSYHNWIIGVGQGHTLAMENKKKFKFFMKHIGPNPSVGILPVELKNMDQAQQLEEIKKCRTKLNSGRYDKKTVYHLAALNWYRNNIPDACENMKIAHDMDPRNPSIHFSCAYLSERYNRLDFAGIYRNIIKKHPRTIWKVYAEIQLEYGGL